MKRRRVSAACLALGALVTVPTVPARAQEVATALVKATTAASDGAGVR